MCCNFAAVRQRIVFRRDGAVSQVGSDFNLCTNFGLLLVGMLGNKLAMNLSELEK